MSTRNPTRRNDGMVLSGEPVVEVPGDGRFYRHGWHSWSPTGWFDRGAEPTPVAVPAYRLTADDPMHLDDRTLGGSWVGATEGGDGDCTLLGSLGLDARVHLADDVMHGIGGGEWLRVEGSEQAVFAHYAAYVESIWGARATDPGPIWCSWYSFYRDIDMELLRDVVRGLGDLPFAVVQVDDGWQRAIGDWHPNEKFSAGMPAMAEDIRRTGRVAGLWLAPFLVDEAAPVATEQPELLLRGPDGAPVTAAVNWGGRAYALDLTHPAAVEFVADSIRAARAWGFDFLKLDFLYAAALPGNRHTALGREGTYRNAVEEIRDAAGEDCFLLACGAPIIPSIGVFDAIRVGPDVAPYWEDEARVRYLHDRSAPGAADAIATSLSRLWLQDLITVDPDVAFFRSRGNLLTPDQRRLLADLAIVCGFRATSDPPQWLESGERAELERFLVERPEVTRLGRHIFSIGHREVDFTSIVEGRPQ